jgi:hypothetical protein
MREKTVIEFDTGAVCVCICICVLANDIGDFTVSTNVLKYDSLANKCISTEEPTYELEYT